jgi:serine/threonine-protein kinase
MEAYLDSLSQGLINRSHSEEKQRSDPKRSTQSSPASSATGTAKLAEVIREQRARKEQQVGGSASGKRDRCLVSSQAAKTIPETQKSGSRKSKTASKKLDADAVLTAYQKGRRDFGQQDLRGLNLKQAHLSEGIFQQN